MKFNPAGGRDPASTSGPKRTGIPGRVEAATKHAVPAPKGKGLVMMLLAVAVMAALIWEFMGRGAAGRAVRRGAEDAERVVAPDGTEDGTERPRTPRPERPRAPDRGLITLDTGTGKLSLTPESALSLFVKAEPEDQASLRPRILAALVESAGQPGPVRGRAFEAAAWLADSATEGDAAEIARLTRKALGALEDDDAASGAILFLSRLPDGGGALAASALDDVILRAARPLALRIAAANARKGAALPAALAALRDDIATHPALRDALKR